MHAYNLVVNDGTTWKTVEGIAKLLPHFHRKTATAFIIKSIDTVDTSALVVSAQQEEVFWIFDFVGEQQTNNLQGLFATVYVVTQE